MLNTEDIAAGKDNPKDGCARLGGVIDALNDFKKNPSARQAVQYPKEIVGRKQTKREYLHE